MIYVLENDYLKAYVSDLGATLVKLIDKKTDIDLVLGYDTDQEYIDNALYLGASVGRNANRIGNAKFELNGQTYKLAVNDNMNSLHGGGINGFSFKRWNKKVETREELTLSYDSIDGEEGFPGNLTVDVTYKLDKNNLIWSYSGRSDKDTILNMTNHSYFNLGDDNIYNLELNITTDKYSPVDEYGLTLDEVKDVKGSAYDFTSFTNVKENIDKLPNGIDNNYVWENLDDKLMASLKNSKLQLNVYSDMPDMHLYTGNFLNGSLGKYNMLNNKHAGLCLECQYYPNSINYDGYIKPILKSGEVMNHYIKYEVISKESVEFSKLVEDRRSCRSFKKEEVKREDIEEIIACALKAPSWKNSETGRYYVALDEKTINEVYNCLPDFNQTSSKNASYIIATFKKGISGNGDDNWGSYDLGLQNSYLILKAKELGYDTLIMGLRDENKLRAIFNIPEDEIMLPVIAIGMADGQLAIRPRKALDEVLKIK